MVCGQSWEPEGNLETQTGLSYVRMERVTHGLNRVENWLEGSSGPLTAGPFSGVGDNPD